MSKVKSTSTSKRLSNGLKKALQGTIKEFKRIRWCSLKDWLKATILVVGVSAIIAGLLIFFNWVVAYIVPGLGSLGWHFIPRQALQWVLFILACVLLVLCYATSNKGDDVLKGLSGTGSDLFEKTKSGVVDKRLTRIIWIGVAIFFAISIFAQ